MTSQIDPVTALTTQSHPTVVTIASTNRVFTYTLSCSIFELGHVATKACDLGESNALIEAVVQALTSITTAWRTRLLKDYSEYQEYLDARSRGMSGRSKTQKPPLLPITIRTDNSDLVIACEYLRSESSNFDDETSVLKKQLRRFDVTWDRLPHGTEEIERSKAWAERLFCAAA